MQDYAREAIRQLIGASLVNVGFERAEQHAMQQLEEQVLHRLGNIMNYAHELACSTRRNYVQVRDVVTACENFGASLHQLDELRACNLGKEMLSPSVNLEARTGQDFCFVPPPPRVVQSMKILQSGAHSNRAMQNRDPRGPETHLIAPDFYPPLPHEHLYRQTPVFMTISGEAADTVLVRLDHRVTENRLIEQSLRNLVQKTDRASLPERAPTSGIKLKLVGENKPVVNWEVVNAADTATSNAAEQIAQTRIAPSNQKRLRVLFSI